MSKNIETKRASLIDGSVETQLHTTNQESNKNIVPIFEEILVDVLTLDGIEKKRQKRLVGFKPQEKE